MLCDVPQPEYALVEWAERQDGLSAPGDHPWYFATPLPTRKAPAWKAQCRCGEIVSMKAHPTADVDCPTWLAQCRACGTILWSMQDTRTMQ